MAKLQLWWVRGTDPPQVGVGDSSYDEARFFIYPMPPTPTGINPHPAKPLWLRARVFGAALNAEVDIASLRRDLAEARSRHYFNTRNIRREEVTQERLLRERSAQERAQDLLRSALPLIYKEVCNSYAFYMDSPEGERFLVDVSNRNVVWLQKDSPRGLCIYLRDSSVQQNKWDWTLAVYLYIRGATKTFLETANEYRRLRGGASFAPLSDSQLLFRGDPSDGLLLGG